MELNRVDPLIINVIRGQSYFRRPIGDQEASSSSNNFMEL